MAKVQTDEMRNRGREVLERDLQEARQELMNLRFRKATLQLEDVTQVTKARKQVARLLTLLRERELTEE